MSIVTKVSSTSASLKFKIYQDSVNEKAGRLEKSKCPTKKSSNRIETTTFSQVGTGVENHHLDLPLKSDGV